jgi:hypothetical protein
MASVEHTRLKHAIDKARDVDDRTAHREHESLGL